MKLLLAKFFKFWETFLLLYFMFFIVNNKIYLIYGLRNNGTGNFKFWLNNSAQFILKNFFYKSTKELFALLLDHCYKTITNKRICWLIWLLW